MLLHRLAFILSAVSLLQGTAVVADSLAWLAEPNGAQALEWVKKQNARTLGTFTRDPRYSSYYQTMLMAPAEQDSDVPGVGAFGYTHLYSIQNGWLYAAHRKQNERGKITSRLWQRIPVASLQTRKAHWQTLLDIDRLSETEKGDRLLVGALPNGNRWMLRFLAGSSMVWREFDVGTRSFVKNGFATPFGTLMSEADGIAWQDADTLLVAMSMPNGPAVVRRWARGTSLNSAPEVFRSAARDDSTIRGLAGMPETLVSLDDERGVRHFYIYDGSAYWTLRAQGRAQSAGFPAGARLSGVYRGEVLFTKDGSLFSVKTDAHGGATQAVRTVKKQSSNREQIKNVWVTPPGLIVWSYSNVRARLELFTVRDEKWIAQSVAIPDNGLIRNSIASDSRDSAVYVEYQNPLQPRSLYRIDAAGGVAVELQRQPESFPAGRYITEQFEAVSADGVRVPYFVVRPAGLRLDGQAPTLMYGYGAHGNPRYPEYVPEIGLLWLSQGGVYVRANIRGGSELGESWHVRGVDRKHTYDDIAAVAGDLIRRKITSPRRLGISGMSCGGLLSLVAIMQRPELFNAAVPEVAVSDQFRPDRSVYEFGSLQDPAVVRFLQDTSPMQALRSKMSLHTPLIVTSTTDNDVPPGQPRRLAAKMQSLGIPFYFYETPSGGHEITDTPEGHAKYMALKFTYLSQRLVD